MEPRCDPPAVPMYQSTSTSEPYCQPTQRSSGPEPRPETSLPKAEQPPPLTRNTGRKPSDDELISVSFTRTVL